MGDKNSCLFVFLHQQYRLVGILLTEIVCAVVVGQFQIAYLAHCLCLVLTQFKVLPIQLRSSAFLSSLPDELNHDIHSWASE